MTYTQTYTCTLSLFYCVFILLYIFDDIHKTIIFDDIVLFTSSGAVIKTDRLPEWIEPIDNCSRLFAMYIPHIKQHFNQFYHLMSAEIMYCSIVLYW